ncbi:hypothetical protein JKP88DRAFT_352777 [Tribonema minus]|uniref:PB1 domain-containing protein n=1 Tax=Tribonema minus TaxID=303371 RepID=A0A835ZD84_9STRA|nr:hypothetical protein JKP88DRAFT_352777 [Tribonema minus]
MSAQCKFIFDYGEHRKVRRLLTPITYQDLRESAQAAHGIKEDSFFLSYLDKKVHVDLVDDLDLQEGLKTAADADNELAVYIWRTAEERQRAVAGGAQAGFGAGSGAGGTAAAGEMVVV